MPKRSTRSNLQPAPPLYRKVRKFGNNLPAQKVTVTTRTHTWWASTWGTSLSSGSTSGASGGRHKGHPVRGFDANGTDGEVWAGTWTGFPGWDGSDGNIVVLCTLSSSGTANMVKTMAVRMCRISDGITIQDIEPNSVDAQDPLLFNWDIDSKAGSTTPHLVKIPVKVGEGYLGAEQDIHSFSLVISDTGSSVGPGVKVHSIGFESNQSVIKP